jgi:hypothetical protein
MAPDNLEAFIDKTIELGAAQGYHPTIFIDMQRELGTVKAIKKLVVSGDIQSGFKRLVGLGLRDCTIEAAVLKYPTHFTRGELEAAKYRLDQAMAGVGSAKGS